MKRSGLILAAAAAFLGLGAAASSGLGVGAPSLPIVGGMTQRERRDSRTKQATSSWVYRKGGPGWTHAQVQRMARKRKNQARNRKAHRG